MVMHAANSLSSYDNLQRVVLYTCLFYLSYCYLPRFLVFLDIFPHEYTWEELFLNYEAGFLRRGLLGAIAHGLFPAVTPLVFYGTVIGVGYFLTLHLSADFFGKFDPLVIILAFASPALLAFPAYAFQALGRKDLLITLFTLILAKLAGREARRAASPNRIRQLYAFFTIGAGLCILIHELEAFLVPIQLFIMSVLLWPTGRTRDIIACSCAAAVFLLLLDIVLFAFPVSPGAGDIICQSWAEAIPALSCQAAFMRNNPFRWLSIAPKDGLGLALSIMTAPATAASYALGLLLALAPAIVATRLYGQRHFTTVAKGSLFLRLCHDAGVLVPFGLFFAGMDYGRWINLIATHALVAACAVIAAAHTPQELERRNGAIHARRLEFLSQRPVQSAASAFLLVVYLSSWRMEHYVPAGAFALRGDLLQAVASCVATIRKLLP